MVQLTEDAIIANTSLDWGTVPKKVYFMHGNPREIVEVLQSYTASFTRKNKKYPMVHLFRDMREEISKGIYGLEPTVQCRLVICTLTKKDLRADDRESQNFKPILLPIFEELINQISKSKLFGMPSIDDMKIKKWDRYYWGSSEVDKNKLNDYIDAVEVESISLKLKNFC